MKTADDFSQHITSKPGRLSGQPVRERVTLDTRASGAPIAPSQALATELGLEFVVLAGRTVAAEILALLPLEFATRHQVFPLARMDDHLVVALADPMAVGVIDSLPHVTGTAVSVCVASPEDIREAIVRHYEQPARMIEQLLPVAEAASNGSASGVPASAEDRRADATVIRLVHDLILTAVHQRASDIHFEPLADRFRVRCRIDGALVEIAAPARRHQLALISRLKIMANLSIAEKRVPQDGRMQMELGGRVLDFRVSSLPTTHGESIVMRILDQSRVRLGMEELGLEADDRELLTQLVTSPDGMVLVTGPTGSGKTSTLYGCLHHLNHPDRKIITVEDPVEYQLTGVNQVPVRAEIGMTFATALRAMLRQAPNVVMVGEIRDRETADMAVNAALTGHFVLSTLHTNDAAGAVARLTDIGVKPFLVAAGLRASIAQRLVRRICPHCRRPHTPAAHELRTLGASAEQLTGAQLMRGTGCSACHGTGFRGRLGIFEIFLVNDEIRGLVYENASAGRLRQSARKAGRRTLREDGIRKVLAGQTTIAEVASVTAGDID